MPSASFLESTLAAGGLSPVYAVYAVSKAGAVLATLTSKPANILSIEDELDGPGSCAIELPTTAITQSDVSFPTEIQVWREGRCIFWGPVSRVDANADTVQLQCRGLLWYFMRRFFGKADRDNLIANGDMETGTLTSWTSSGPDTATTSTSIKIEGTKSAKLVEGTAGADSYIYQNVSVTAGGVGELITVAAWFYIEAFTSAALNNRGLFIEVENGATVESFNETDGFIDDQTPRLAWQRAEATVWMAPNTTRTINVRLYAPAGTIYWDAVTVTKMESLSFYAQDQARIAEHIVAYAQDNQAFTHGKSDLLIPATVTTCPNTGVTRDVHYQMADHANIGQTLVGFTQLNDGFDISVEQNGSLRFFHTWYPSKGTDRGATPGSGVSTVTITNAMLAGGGQPFGWRFDGEQAANQIVILGDGDGPDREEGGATDNSAFGGTTFEDITAAEPATPIDRLDPLATERLRALKDPESVTVTVHEPTANLLGTVVVGDTIKLELDHGYINANGDYRVIARRFQPGVETLTLELNPA